MEAKCYRAMWRAQGKMLREYFSGVSVESLSRRYGYSVIKIKTLASDYKQGKIDIFDDPQKRKIATSIMTHQEEVQLLRDKIRALENALKLSNIKAEDPASELDEHLWIQPGDDQGAWASGGTYLCFRKIKMMMEVWDELALGEQERTIGRDKLEGAPLSGGEEFSAPDFHKTSGAHTLINADSHVALMHPDNNRGRRMLRRGYNYLEGVDYLGRLDAGLFFIAFVRDPAEGFIPVLSRMSKDLLTEYLQHVASSVYLVLPGIGQGDAYVGQRLLAS